jgi:hypothetical protein
LFLRTTTWTHTASLPCFTCMRSRPNRCATGIQVGPSHYSACGCASQMRLPASGSRIVTQSGSPAATASGSHYNRCNTRSTFTTSRQNTCNIRPKITETLETLANICLKHLQNNLKHLKAICKHMQNLDLLLQHLDETLATYV